MPQNNVQRARSYVWTLNNYTDDHCSSIEAAFHGAEQMKYIVYGKEVAETTGTPHLQGYVQYNVSTAFTIVKRQLPQGTHIEKAQGRPDQAADYCKKGEQPHAEWDEQKTDGPNYGVNADVTEFGEPPKSPKRKGEQEKARWQRAWDVMKEGGDIEEVDPDIRIRMYGTLKKIKADYQHRPAPNDEIDCHWYYGPSGTGKSWKAHTENPGAYLKARNKWWDGYTGEHTVLIEEWSPQNECTASLLKQWCDHWAFPAETKGGTLCLRPKKLIITSNYSLDECFPNEQDFGPMKRRFKVTHFGNVNFRPPAPPAPAT